jgi:hypothetical protein
LTTLTAAAAKAVADMAQVNTDITKLNTTIAGLPTGAEKEKAETKLREKKQA